MVVVPAYHLFVEGVERTGSYELLKCLESFYKSTIGLGFADTTFDLGELSFEE